MIAWTPVHAIDDCRLDLTLAVSPRHLQKVRRVGHSPTREKNREVTRLNRGTDSPINCRHSPLLPTLRVAPTREPTCARAVVWPFATWPRRAPPALHVRLVRSTCASCPPRGPPAACHAALGPCRLRAVARVPRVASTVSPLATSARRLV